MSLYFDMEHNCVNSYVDLSLEARHDLEFWLYGFDKFDGYRKIWSPLGHDVTIFYDAAGKNLFSFGAWAGWTADAIGESEQSPYDRNKIRVARGVWSEEQGSESSTRMDLLAILNVIKSFNSNNSLSCRQACLA